MLRAELRIYGHPVSSFLSQGAQQKIRAVSAVQYALAIRSAVPFQKIITPDLRALASEAMVALERSVIIIGEVAYPDTLPVGSGNDCGDSFRRDRFFDTNKKVNF